MNRLRDIINEIFSEISRSEPLENDFVGEDGLLHCGKCRTKKETRIRFPTAGGNMEMKTVPCVCKCRQEELEEERRADEYRERQQRICSLRQSSLIETKFKKARLSGYMVTDDNHKVFELANRYVNGFKEMYQKNQGILFWGEVGTGKSYTAACIANELIENMHTVIMTSFVKILQDIQTMKVDESVWIKKLQEAELLVIDDLGTERNTEYALEKVYNVIDSRYRSGKPLILTTNLILKDMIQTTDIRYRRIYDRIFEMCYPVHVRGRSYREAEAARRFDNMQKLLES